MGRYNSSLAEQWRGELQMGTADPASPCHLILLPAELRNAIWEFALIETASIPIAAAPASVNVEGTLARLPGLTQSSRQIRSETLPIYLSQNIFLVKRRNATCRPWMMAFGPLQPHFVQIRKLEIVTCCSFKLICRQNRTQVVTWHTVDCGKCVAASATVDRIRKMLQVVFDRRERGSHLEDEYVKSVLMMCLAKGL